MIRSHNQTRGLVKATALVVALTFVLPMVTFAFGPATYPADPVGAYGLTPFKINGQTIKISPQWGMITSSYQGHSDKTVVYIQDLHCHYEVQDHIYQMLKSLVERNHLKLIGIEGESKPVDVSPISTIARQNVRQEVGDYFIKRGRLTGPEYLASISGQPVVLAGIEKQQLYDYSKEKLTQFLTDENQGYVEDLRFVLEKLKAPLYSTELAKLDHMQAQFDGEQIPLENFVNYLLDEGDRLGVSFKAYSALNTYAVHRQMPYQGNVDYERLLDAARQYDQTVRDKLYTTQDQRRLDHYLKLVRIMESLINISATDQELTYYRGHKKEFSITTLFNFLDETCYRYAVNPNLDPNAVQLEKALAWAAEFYGAADQRSQAFIKNLLSQMDQRGQKLAVLVTGGFHAAQLEKALRSRDMTYLAIKPRLTRNDLPNPYFNVLKGRLSPIEQLIAQHENIFAPRSIFSSALYRRYIDTVKQIALAREAAGAAAPRQPAKELELKPAWSNPANNVYVLQFKNDKDVLVVIRNFEITNYPTMADAEKLDDHTMFQFVAREVWENPDYRAKILGSEKLARAAGPQSQPSELLDFLSGLSRYLGGISAPQSPLSKAWSAVRTGSSSAWATTKTWAAQGKELMFNPHVIMWLGSGLIMAGGVLGMIITSATLWPLIATVGAIMVMITSIAQMRNQSTPVMMRAAMGFTAMLVAGVLIFNLGLGSIAPLLAKTADLVPTLQATGILDLGWFALNYHNIIPNPEMFAAVGLLASVNTLAGMLARRLGWDQSGLVEEPVESAFYPDKDTLIEKALIYASSQFNYGTEHIRGDNTFKTDLEEIMAQTQNSRALQTFISNRADRLALAGMAYRNGRLSLTEDTPTGRLLDLARDFVEGENLAQAVLKGDDLKALKLGNSHLAQLISHILSGRKDQLFVLGAKDPSAPERLAPAYFTPTQLEAIKKLAAQYHVPMVLSGMNLNPLLGLKLEPAQVRTAYAGQMAMATAAGIGHLELPLVGTQYATMEKPLAKLAKKKGLSLEGMVPQEQATIWAENVSANMRALITGLVLDNPEKLKTFLDPVESKMAARENRAWSSRQGLQIQGIKKVSYVSSGALKHVYRAVVATEQGDLPLSLQFIQRAGALSIPGAPVDNMKSALTEARRFRELAGMLDKPRLARQLFSTQGLMASLPEEEQKRLGRLAHEENVDGLVLGYFTEGETLDALPDNRKAEGFRKSVVTLARTWQQTLTKERKKMRGLSTQDFKPQNFVYNAETNEVELIDMDLANYLTANMFLDNLQLYFKEVIKKQLFPGSETESNRLYAQVLWDGLLEAWGQEGFVNYLAAYVKDMKGSNKVKTEYKERLEAYLLAKQNQELLQLAVTANLITADKATPGALLAGGETSPSQMAMARERKPEGEEQATEPTELVMRSSSAQQKPAETLIAQAVEQQQGRAPPSEKTPLDQTATVSSQEKPTQGALKGAEGESLLKGILATSGLVLQPGQAIKEVAVRAARALGAYFQAKSLSPHLMDSDRWEKVKETLGQIKSNPKAVAIKAVSSTIDRLLEEKIKINIIPSAQDIKDNDNDLEQLGVFNLNGQVYMTQKVYDHVTNDEQLAAILLHEALEARGLDHGTVVKIIKLLGFENEDLVAAAGLGEQPILNILPSEDLENMIYQDTMKRYEVSDEAGHLGDKRIVLKNIYDPNITIILEKPESGEENLYLIKVVTPNAETEFSFQNRREWEMNRFGEIILKYLVTNSLPENFRNGVAATVSNFYRAEAARTHSPVRISILNPKIRTFVRRFFTNYYDATLDNDGVRPTKKWDIESNWEKFQNILWVYAKAKTTDEVARGILKDIIHLEVSAKSNWPLSNGAEEKLLQVFKDRLSEWIWINTHDARKVGLIKMILQLVFYMKEKGHSIDVEALISKFQAQLPYLVLSSDVDNLTNIVMNLNESVGTNIRLSDVNVFINQISQNSFFSGTNPTNERLVSSSFNRDNNPTLINQVEGVTVEEEVISDKEFENLFDKGGDSPASLGYWTAMALRNTWNFKWSDRSINRFGMIWAVGEAAMLAAFVSSSTLSLSVLWALALAHLPLMIMAGVRGPQLWKNLRGQSIIILGYGVLSIFGLHAWLVAWAGVHLLKDYHALFNPLARAATNTRRLLSYLQKPFAVLVMITGALALAGTVTLLTLQTITVLAAATLAVVVAGLITAGLYLYTHSQTIVLSAKHPAPSAAEPSSNAILQLMRKEQSLGVTPQPGSAFNFADKLAITMGQSRLGRFLMRMIRQPVGMRLFELLSQNNLGRLLNTALVSALWSGLGTLPNGLINGDEAMAFITNGLSATAPGAFIRLRLQHNEAITSTQVRAILTSSEVDTALMDLERQWSRPHVMQLLKLLVKSFDQLDANDTTSIRQLLQVMSQIPGPQQRIGLRLGNQPAMEMIALPKMVIEQPSLFLLLKSYFNNIYDQKGQAIEIRPRRLNSAAGAA